MSEGEVGLGQVTHNAARVYEEFFLPALMQQWTERVVAAAAIQPGDHVLDVACGTGVLAREAARRVGPQGVVVGMDVNESMLAVAEEKAPEIQWELGRAEEMPFHDQQFDAVVSQFGLMFFQDRQAALREMMRVLRPGGHVAVAVWGPLEQSPGYTALADLLLRLFGPKAAGEIRAPFVLGDAQSLRAIFVDAGIADAQVMTEPGTARFPSLHAWLYTEIKGWTLADVIDDAQFEQLLEEAAQELQPFVMQDGTVMFPMPANIVTATKK